MAWGTAYRLEFYDIWEDENWRVDFNLQDYEGEIYELQGSGEALIFDFQNDSDDPFAPIKPSRAIMSIVNKENVIFSDLCDVGDMDVWVEIYDATWGLYWCGWIDPKQYEQPYDIRPNVVNIVAIDGLTLLDSILFADEDSEERIEYYYGRKRESKIVLDILAKIGYSEFIEFDNIFEERMRDSIDDSPLDQTMIDCEFAKNMYCLEVLEYILRKKNACIRQVDGVFCIYRPKALVTANHIYGRHFTDETTKLPINYDPNQYVRRAQHDTNFKQIPGGTESLIRPARKIVLKQDYGNRDSWIRTWDFLPNAYTPGPKLSYGYPSPGTWEHWTGGDVYIVSEPLLGYLTYTFGELVQDKEGIQIWAESSLRANSVHQTFGTYLVETSDNPIAFSFSYRFISYRRDGGPFRGIHVYIKVQALNSNNWLAIKDDTFLEWKNTESYIDIAAPDLVVTGNAWQSFSRIIKGLPDAGPYQITLYSPYSASTTSFSLVYKDIRMHSTSGYIKTFITYPTGPFHNFYQLLYGRTFKDIYYERDPIVQEEHIAINDTEGDIRQYQNKLGDILAHDCYIDNVLEQFKGCLGLVNPQYCQHAITIENGTPSTGRASISCNGRSVSWLYGANAYDTAAAFATDPTVISIFNDVQVDVSYIGYIIYFTHQQKGIDFSPAAAITELIAEFKGTASIRTYGFSTIAPIHTKSWYIKNEDSSEATTGKLMDLMKNEIAKQYERSTHFITMEMIDLNPLATLNLIGNLQDTESFGIVGSNLMTDPNGTSDDYDTFDINGIRITSAITDGPATALSNIFAVTEGETIQVNIDLTLNSGQAPSIAIGVNIVTILTEVVQLTNGINKVSLKINSSSAVAKLIIVNGEPSNWSTGDIEVYHTGVRKYVINRGEFRVRSRRWTLDLQEMVE
jgi:hypothetical protein